MKVSPLIFAVVTAFLHAAPVRAAEPPITAIAFTPDERTVLVGSQSGVRLLDWPSLKLSKTLSSELRHVHAMAFNPAGDRLLIAGGSPGEHGSVELFSWPQCKRLYSATLHDDLVYGVAWLNDGQQFATASADHRCMTVSAADGKPRITFAGHSEPVLSVCVLADGKTAVSAGVDQVLHVWNLADGQPIRRRHNHTDTVTAMAVRPGKHTRDMIATGSLDRTVRLWQPTIGRMVRFARLPSEVLSLSWSADGGTILAGCRDGGVYAVDADRVVHVKRAQIDGWVYGMATRKDGDAVAGASAGLIKRVSPPPK